MSSSRKDRRSRESSPKPRLRMDTYQAGSRNDRSSRSSYRGSSAPRSKELNSVMKKARSGGSQSTYWNKRLLEVEEKDPNRWRHSGYKELYHDEKKSKSRSRSRSVSRGGPRSPRSPRSPSSRSVSGGRSRSRSYPRPRSPRQRSAKPLSPRARSPRARSPRPRSPRPRSPRPRSPRPRSPPSPRSPPPSPPMRRRTPPRVRRPPSPKARSESYSSSDSSCSDESCSVCSRKTSRKNIDNKKEKDKPWKERTARAKERERERARRPNYRPYSRSRSRSRSFSVPRSRNDDKRLRRDPRTLTSRERSALKVNRSHFIKVESDSESSGSGGSAGGGGGGSVGGGGSGGPRLSLSERFGKMAQWSVDRDLEHRNLRITSGDRLTVEMDSPPSPLPYPPSLSSLVDYGSWDDVRTRYAYYKDQGYLRDLTLQDYLRWEQWWYKYQDWLDGERYYDSRRDRT